MGKEDCLFCAGDLDAVLRTHQSSISTKVDAIPHDQFMNAHPDEIADCIFADMVIEPLVIYEDRKEMEQRETKINMNGHHFQDPFYDDGPIHVPGVSVTVSIPFTGDPLLWKLKPNQYSFPPRARITSEKSKNHGQVQIVLIQTDDEPLESIKNRLDEVIKTIKFYIQSQKQQIDSFNIVLRSHILTTINARRTRLIKQEGIKNILGIPLKRKEGTPAIEPIKIVRKLARPLPPPPNTGYKDEPGIIETDYAHILSVIRHEGRTFETTPKTYSVHDEEALRDILLAHLNGHYQGTATGEAFRHFGKTDIRIEDNKRAAFVAECKVWKGQKELSQAIDQLLSYLTWRDCKACIIIFNKNNAKFSGIIDTVSGVFENHPLYRRSEKTNEHGEWAFNMTSSEDEGRQVRVHVFAFNLYVG